MKKAALAVIAFVSTAALAAEKEVVDITITGGPSAGKYRATTDRGGCSVGLSGPGSFGNQLSDPKATDPKAFNSLQLVVPDPRKRAEFQLSVGFGPILNRGAVYEVDTRAGKQSGSGSVIVNDHGSTAKVNFSATTRDGVKLEGTIDCKSVMRAG